MGNVTIDPVSRATAVAAPEIREIRAIKSGQILNAAQFIESVRYDRIIRIRSLIKEAMEGSRPRVVCAICGTPVYLVATTEKAFFFRHRIEDGSCPAETRNGLTDDELRAMKYKGAQESDAHRRLKNLIERSLRADKEFQDIQIEKTWRGQRDSAALRRPDVQARREELRVAFEAQLTTTFLDVVIGRKLFYLSEGGLLVWILPYFDPSYRQLTIDDVLFNNNSNVLVVDRETTEASEAAGCFIVRCFYRRPVLNGSVLGASWESCLTKWDKLSIRLDKQQVFAFDYETAEQQLLGFQKAANDQAARDALFAAVTSRPEDSYWEERLDAWQALKRRFIDRNLHLAGEHGPDPTWRSVICAVLSAHAGHPVGYNFEKLVQVAHHLADRYPMGLVPFFQMLRVAGYATVISDQDKTGLWARKAEKARARVRGGDPAYAIDPQLGKLLTFLFPHISKPVPRS